MPQITITNCTIDDGADVAHNNVPACWQNANWVIMWPGKTCEYVASQAALRQPHNLYIGPARKRHFKAVDETGALVGYARWMLPEVMPEGKPDDAWPEGLVPRVSEERAKQAQSDHDSAWWEYESTTDHLDSEIQAMSKAKREGKNYLYLAYLAVHPDHQRKGIATQLVKNGLEQAEKLGLDVFVLSLKAGLKTYLNCGFKVVDQLVFDDSKYGGDGEYAAYCMLNEVSTGKKAHQHQMST